MLRYWNMVDLQTQLVAARRYKEFYIDSRDFNSAAEQRDVELELVRQFRLLNKLIDDIGEIMFERFTDRARRVVVLAQEEARMLNHNYIGTEHILLGLIHEGEGVACKALEAMGISLEGVRSQVEEIIGQGEKAPVGHIPFTLRAKKMLELSLREALQLGHNYIGTEHILLGLIREGEGVGSQILTRLGAGLTPTRREVIKLLSGYQGKLTAEQQPGPIAPPPTVSPSAAPQIRERLRKEAEAREALAAMEFGAKQTFDIVSKAWTLLTLLIENGVDPSPQLVARLIEWKSQVDEPADV